MIIWSDISAEPGLSARFPYLNLRVGLSEAQAWIRTVQQIFLVWVGLSLELGLNSDCTTGPKSWQHGWHLNHRNSNIAAILEPGGDDSIWMSRGCPLSGFRSLSTIILWLIGYLMIFCVQHSSKMRERERETTSSLFKKFGTGKIFIETNTVFNNNNFIYIIFTVSNYWIFKHSIN